MKNGRLNEEQKAKWLKGMDNVYMSSEESGYHSPVAMENRICYVLLHFLVLVLLRKVAKVVRRF